MPWAVEFHPAFAAEVAGLPLAVRAELKAMAELLQKFGPTLGRPRVDTLAGSRVANLKELRFSANGGVWRVAFVFDGRRIAMLLAGGDKQGVAQRRFYQRLIALAERRLKELKP